ncbi:uncharacterized protein LOC124381868 isoform X2 [Silurus meridionalis]|uniref:uncharacterized protein LOC124381868 isoform X2 n=1 Tax=Silurus meridionalis TaxID=175797 RepID=UPI001EEA7070|nr:uncharacterized protein LOC124381868 isoform X2 [Silurus meridionalis]
MEGGDETVRTKRRCQFSSRVTCLNAELNMTRALKNNLLTKVSRPDWLLYAIPSVAFVLGVLLFLLVFRTQRRKEKAFRRVAALKAVMNTTSTGHTYTSQHPMGTQNKDSSKIQNSSKTQGNLTKQEAQSYENVTTIIYSNEDKVNYRVIQDEDGESYENMEACVYAHPRQPTLKDDVGTKDDDYINPDEEHIHNLVQTDTASYENMADSVCPDIGTHTNTHSDEGWYECMDRRKVGGKPT